MKKMNIKDRTLEILNKDLTKDQELITEVFEDFLVQLEQGQIRVAEKQTGKWKVNTWVKKGILLGFKLGNMKKLSKNPFSFIDKDTYPLRDFTEEDGVRIVPPASGARRGSFVSKGVVLMPPAYINVGAYVDKGTMVESLVGSCAQIGKNVHISAGVTIGGVLDPIEASPVIIEDDVLLGEGVGITQGTRILELATIAPGVHISGSTPVFDTVKSRVYSKYGTHKLIKLNMNGISVFKQGELIEKKDSSFGPIIPKGALVISGISLSSNDFFKYSPIIVKYIEKKEDRSFALEEALR